MSKAGHQVGRSECKQFLVWIDVMMMTISEHPPCQEIVGVRHDEDAECRQYQRRKP